MRLSKAAGYFTKTAVAGWSGSAWIDNVTTVALLPIDREISEDEFSEKRRMLLVRYNDTALTAYSVIKISSTGDVYLVGAVASDIQVDRYSKVQIVHLASYIGGLYHFVKNTVASGLAGSVTRTLLGNFHCDIEHQGIANSEEFSGVTLPRVNLRLPSDCAVDTGQELTVAGRDYEIHGIALVSGIKVCRALSKRS